MFSRCRTRVIALLAVLGLAACSPAQDRGPVILAASSMTEAVEEVADSWAKQGHARPVLSFAGTSSLARQAEAGAPADVFLSADEQWMNWLAQRGLVQPASRRDIVSNSLTWIARNEADARVPQGARAALLGPDRLALADPGAVPAGRYAKAALQQMGLWEALAPHIVPAENVRAALALVESGEARYAIVYSSDAQASQKVVNAGEIAPEYTPQILYPAALLEGSTHPDAGPFLDYLSGEQAAQIFRKHGFVAAGDCAPC